MMFIAIVLLLTSTSVVNSQDLLNDLCNLSTVGEGTSLEIPAGCTSGDVDWHYPQGKLILSSGNNYGGDYQLCVEESWFTVLDGVMELTGGRNRALPVPTEGNPTCIHELDGVTKLQLEVTQLMYYMTTFTYKIKEPCEKKTA